MLITAGKAMSLNSYKIASVITVSQESLLQYKLKRAESPSLHYLVKSEQRVLQMDVMDMI